jgi:hypothetical protein
MQIEGKSGLDSKFFSYIYEKLPKKLNIYFLFSSKSPENHQATKLLVSFAWHQNLKKKIIMACSPLEQLAIIALIPIHIGNLYISFMCETHANYLMVKTFR